MAVAILAGSTGHVGSSILSSLLAHPSFSAVYAYSRRDLPNPAGSTKLHQLTTPTTSQWVSLFPARSLSPAIMFSGLATTRGDAGGFDNQRKIDYDLNLELARAAKDAGVETYVLVSSQSANASSMWAYMKMKGELENSITELGFKRTVFLRPGFIAGERTSRQPGVAEKSLSWLAKSLGNVSPALKNGWAQDGELIAKAAVVAGVQCLEGKRQEGVWVVEQAEIVKLGAEL